MRASPEKPRLTAITLPVAWSSRNWPKPVLALSIASRSLPKTPTRRPGKCSGESSRFLCARLRSWLDRTCSDGGHDDGTRRRHGRLVDLRLRLWPDLSDLFRPHDIRTG